MKENDGENHGDFESKTVCDIGRLHKEGKPRKNDEKYGRDIDLKNVVARTSLEY